MTLHLVRHDDGDGDEVTDAFLALVDLVNPADFGAGGAGIKIAQFRAIEEAASKLLDVLDGARPSASTILDDLLAAIEGPIEGRGAAAVSKLEELQKIARASLQLDVRDDWSGNVVRRPWLIPGWLSSGRVALFTGEGGRGKSRLSLQLCVAMAAAEPDWIGGIGPSAGAKRRYVGGGSPDIVSASVLSPTTVVIASWEDEYMEILRRIDNIIHVRNRAAGAGSAATPLSRQAIGDRLKFVDMSGEGPLWAPSGSGHISTVSALTDTGTRLRDYAARVGATLLVIDPLASAYLGDENARGLVRSFMGSWDRWARDTDCAVMLIAHPSKGQWSGGGSGVGAYSGSTDWHAASRAVWTLGDVYETVTSSGAPRAGSSRAVALTSVKTNYGLSPPSIWLAIDQHGVWSETASPAWVTP